MRPQAIPRPPLDERVQRHVAAMTQRAKEEKAVQAVTQTTTTANVANVEPPTPAKAAPSSKGIESRIDDANAKANGAHSLAASVRTDHTKHVAASEQRHLETQARMADLEREVKELRDAVRDAWHATFWMYADVIQSVDITTAPGGRVMSVAYAPGTVVLFGEMVDTAHGPCMQCRWVDNNTGQVANGWVRLRNADNVNFLTNFRLQY